MTVEQVDAQFKLVEQIHDLRAEIERLRAQLWTDDELEHEMALARTAIIEECARVAESDKWDDYLRPQPHIADAIRALKDKP